MKNSLLMSLTLFFWAAAVVGSEEQPFSEKLENTQQVNGAQLFNVRYREGDKMVTKEAIYRRDIFKYITGMDESEYADLVKLGQKPQLPENNSLLMEKLSHASPTLAQLRKKAAKKLSVMNDNGTLSIIHVDVVKHPELRHLVDIGALQAANPGALFQTASRTNELEGGQTTLKGHENSFDYQDNGFSCILGKWAVQGEEAQISCPIKTIAEIYDTEQLNFFDHLGVDIDSTGNITKIDVDFLKKSTPEQLGDLVRVSHWRNVSVNFGFANVLYQSEAIRKLQKFDGDVRELNDEDANVVVETPHLISQVSVAALDMAPFRDSMKVFRKSMKVFLEQEQEALVEKFAKAVLKAAYEATLYAAIIESKKEVFLTLVGCGSFRNKLAWVAEILENLFNKDIIQQSGLNIKLVVLEVKGGFQAGEDLKAWLRIQNVACMTGGDITSSDAYLVNNYVSQFDELVKSRKGENLIEPVLTKKSISKKPTVEKVQGLYQTILRFLASYGIDIS